MTKTLYEFYSSQGRKLPTVQERQGVASEAGISGYAGTAEQNNRLLAYLQTPKAPPATAPVPAPVAAPAAPVVPSPVPTGVGPTATPAGLGLVFSQDPNQSEIERAIAATTRGYNDGVPDEAKIRQDTIAQFQQELDALDRASGEARARVTAQYQDIGNRRVGSQRALLNDAGMLGQVAGEGEKNRLETANAQELGAAVAAEQAKYDAAKQSLLGQARGMAQESYQQKLQAYQSGANATVEYLRSKSERAQANAVTLAKRAFSLGLDITDKKYANDVAAFAKQVGVSVDTFMDIYSSVKAETESASVKAYKDSLITLSEGQVVVDPTGRVVARGANKPITLSEGEVILNADGSVYKNPKTYDPTDQALNQIKIEEIRNNIANGGDWNKVLSPNDAMVLGVPYGTTQGQAMQQGLTPTKPATDGQNLAAGYANRIKESGDILNKLEGDIAKYNPAGFYVQEKLPNSEKTSQVQEYEQAGRNFINAVLRRESGAAIAESEFKNAYNQYLPRPGDSKEVLANKKQNRTTLLNGLIQSSGPAYKSSGSGSDPLNILGGSDPLGLGFKPAGKPQASNDLKNRNLSYAPQVSPVSVSIGAGAAVRNNNPGNLRNTDGSWMKFSTPEEGFKGLMGYVQRAKTGDHARYSGDQSLYKFFSIYAPAADKNNPKAYAEGVAKRLGVSANTPIGQIDTLALAAEIARHESSTKVTRLA